MCGKTLFFLKCWPVEKYIGRRKPFFLCDISVPDVKMESVGEGGKVCGLLETFRVDQTVGKDIKVKQTCPWKSRAFY